MLNDFDTACYDSNWEETSKRRVGTPGYWSPYCDVDIVGWSYSKDDDWMALALTFGKWLGVYNPQPRLGALACATVKLGVVRTLLTPGFDAPVAFKLRPRMAPVFERVAGDFSMTYELQSLEIDSSDSDSGGPSSKRM